MTTKDDLHFQAFAALQDVRMMAALGKPDANFHSLPASRIVAYARRRDSISDMRIERSLRQEPGLNLLYRRALSGAALAVSMRAIAASGARVTQRLIGDHSLEVIVEADDMQWLVLRLADTRSQVTMIELRGSNGDGRRVELSEPIDGVIQIPIDAEFPELAGVADLIADPATEIYLL